MGVVWAARQPSLSRIVAVKRLVEAPFNARDASALLSEGRITGALEHPAIIPVHELKFAPDGSPLLVMKRVEGVTLGTLIAEPDHPAWQALERRHGDRLAVIVDALMRVSDALEFAHQRGFIHRDVKCENVMVGAFGEVYLLDWGVALSPGEERPVQELVGTPSSMAPEMARGDVRHVDARSDVYLLGATLHHALTGRPRHAGQTLQAVLLAAFHSEPPDLPGVPAELASLVTRATAAAPADRPSSAAAFREELADFLRHRASNLLADAAMGRLAALERDPAQAAGLTSLEASRALTEARFGLTQALREWPENKRATAALERAVILCVKAELVRDSPGAASALLRELHAPPPALVEAVRAAESAAVERAALAARARAQAADLDASLSASVRRRMAGVFAAVLAAFTAGVFALGGVDAGRQLGYPRAFVMDLVFLAASVVLLFVTRARTLVNRWSRNAVGLFVVAALGTTLSHGVGWLRGDDVALRGDSPTQVALAVLFGVGSMLLSRLLLIPALVACGAALVSAFWPPASLWLTAVTALTGVVVLARTSTR